MRPRIPRVPAHGTRLVDVLLPPRPAYSSSPIATTSFLPRHHPRSLSTSLPRGSPAAAHAPQQSHFALPVDYVPPKQPPSAKPTDTRKAQLIRSYTSLLRSTPLMLIFQHNNLDSKEWASVRRELRVAVSALPAPTDAGVSAEEYNAQVKLQVVRTSMFKLALRINEFFDPRKAALEPDIERSRYHGPLVHDLSAAARRAVKGAEESGIVKDPSTAYAELSDLLIGPICLLTLPSVSPAHLAAALGVLSPVPGVFPAPTRRKRPQYYDVRVRSGLPKLLLIGGRATGRLMDAAGMKWIGGIEGGVDGLRARVVQMLRGSGMGIVKALEGAGRSLWFTLEGRRAMLEEEATGDDEGVEEKKETDGDAPT